MTNGCQLSSPARPQCNWRAQLSISRPNSSENPKIQLELRAPQPPKTTHPAHSPHYMSGGLCMDAASANKEAALKLV